MDDEIDELDPDERHDEPAEAVDEQVPPQDVARAARAELHAAQRQRNEAMMISALKITALEDRARRRSRGA